MGSYFAGSTASKTMPWLVRVDVRCPSSRKRISRWRHTKTAVRSASTVSIRGRPSAPTVGPQWPNNVRKCSPEKNGSCPQTYPYPDGWSTTGWFKQNIMKGVPGGNLCRPEVNAITDRVEMGAQQVATRTMHSCGLKGEASPSIYADWVNGGWF